MTPRTDEIAPDLYRISVYVKDFDLQFNHFLIKDDEPLLFHTGMRGHDDGNFHDCIPIAVAGRSVPNRKSRSTGGRLRRRHGDTVTSKHLESGGTKKIVR